jgi:hypothetical protein
MGGDRRTETEEQVLQSRRHDQTGGPVVALRDRVRGGKTKTIKRVAEGIMSSSDKKQVRRSTEDEEREKEELEEGGSIIG